MGPHRGPWAFSLPHSGTSIVGKIGEVSEPEATFLCVPEQEHVLNVDVNPAAHPRARGLSVRGTAPRWC